MSHTYKTWSNSQRWISESWQWLLLHSTVSSELSGKHGSVVAWMWLLWYTPWIHTTVWIAFHTVSLRLYIYLPAKCGILYTHFHEVIMKNNSLRNTVLLYVPLWKWEYYLSIYKRNRETPSHLLLFFLKYSISDNNTIDTMTSNNY